ncbi:MAG: prepilin-type N-terminal cleavage/methylation domain-containing protein [Planctomycetia bacterium]|nr:prepilin-type N-terminal cleavage/methylation domain-containing protein [Planctomycetia bacterium]
MRAGFTLMEVMVVLAVILLVSGFAWPNLRSMMEQSALRTAARELRAELGKTRLRAIETGTVFEVRYSPGTNQIQILAKPTIPRSIDSDTDSSTSLSSGLSGSGSSRVSSGSFGGSGSSGSISSTGSSRSSSSGSSSSSSSPGSSIGSSSTSSGSSVSSSSSGTSSSGLVTKESDLVFGRGLTLDASGELAAEVVNIGSNVWFDDPDYREELSGESSGSTEVRSTSVGDTSVTSIGSASPDGSSKSSSSGSSEDDGDAEEGATSSRRGSGSTREVPLSEQLRRPVEDWPEALSGTDSTGSLSTDSGSSGDFTDWSRPILFFPNGRTSTTTIRLWTVSNRYIEVSLRGATGQVTISKPTRYSEELEELRREERTYLQELREESVENIGTTYQNSTTRTSSSNSRSPESGGSGLTGGGSGSTGTTDGSETVSGTTGNSSGDSLNR